MVENYFNYFTEIEDHFRQRRGTTLLLSTLDWVLMDLWKEAGVPLEAVLRGIDITFERFAERRSKNRKVNGLGFCTQEVLSAAEEMKEAAVGAKRSARENAAAFRVSEIVGFLRQNADALERVELPEARGLSPRPLARETAEMLREIAGQLEQAETLPARLEDLERRLTVAEEKLFAVLLAVIPNDEIVTARAEADHALAPYLRKMPAAQIEQLQKQYIRKRFLDKYGVPRLSLFYL
jgi:CHAT domain-containing protein